MSPVRQQACCLWIWILDFLFSSYKKNISCHKKGSVWESTGPFQLFFSAKITAVTQAFPIKLIKVQFHSRRNRFIIYVTKLKCISAMLWWAQEFELTITLLQLLDGCLRIQGSTLKGADSLNCFCSCFRFVIVFLCIYTMAQQENQSRTAYNMWYCF